MSYVEILVSTIIIGIILIPITFSITDNVFITEENVGFEKAMQLAQNEIECELTGEAVIPITGYTAVRDVQAEQNLIKVTVTWNIAGKAKQYILYGTIPVEDYNS
ncbi:MAG: hypothetical protein A2Y24_01565 [Clostridiales bacterium GWE2_32_10]|nr:MAG: hypothetical protein A2Y24_01565 [Clostridiales bacterium GWE2_32_10]HBY21434.1 hypothetical protein [Clostridiales bacterium]